MSAIRANTSALREHVGSGVHVMAMVKSNGYGHGLRLASEAAIDGGATWLGVASSAEAFDVTTFRVPVLIVGRCDPGSHEALIDQGIETTVYDDEGVDTTAGAAARVGRRARVHVKVDTGMGRLGVAPERLGEFLRTLAKYSADVEIAGVFTNFADSDAPDFGFTDEQHDCFVAAVDEVAHGRARCARALLEQRRHPPGAPHAPRSRPPGHRALRLRARHGRRHRRPPAGDDDARAGHAGENRAGGNADRVRTYVDRARADTRIATVAAGYADGVLRAQSNTGVVLVAGCRCPIVGRVSMDQLCVDITDVDADVRPGDDVALFGEQAGTRLGADEVGGYAGTIEREILTAVADRIPRVVVSPNSTTNLRQLRGLFGVC